MRGNQQRKTRKKWARASGIHKNRQCPGYQVNGKGSQRGRKTVHAADWSRKLRTKNATLVSRTCKSPMTLTKEASAGRWRRNFDLNGSRNGGKE